MTIEEIIMYMKHMEYTFVDGNESNLNFIKPVPGSTYFIKAHVKDWRGPWAVELKFTNLKHHMEIRSGNFRIGNPEFRIYENQLIFYIKSCIQSHI